MDAIAAMLRAIPSTTDTASRYDFDGVSYNTILRDAMRTITFSSNRPEFLAGIENVEVRLDNAVPAVLKMAEFRTNSLSRPAGALQGLAEFRGDFTSSFDRQLAGTAFLADAARPRSALLLFKAARRFDGNAAGQSLAAPLNIKVIQIGQVSIEDMHGGKTGHTGAV